MYMSNTKLPNLLFCYYLMYVYIYVKYYDMVYNFWYKNKKNTVYDFSNANCCNSCHFQSRRGIKVLKKTIDHFIIKGNFINYK